jgi:hypothetical protein
MVLINFHFTAEINRLCQEKDADNEKFDFQREDLNRRLSQLERDMQMALTQEKQAHEDDVDHLTRERVGVVFFHLYFIKTFKDIV